MDTLRADHLGCYGYFRNTSPTIDAFAKQGAILTDAHSQAYHTQASHMSIFTSLYPQFHGVITLLENRKLSIHAKTIAEILKENNYSTVWVAPLKDYNLELDKGFGRGFNEYFESQNVANNTLIHWNNAYKWLKENKDKKFFMFLHTYKVHDPYTPKEESLLRFTNSVNRRIVSSEGELVNETIKVIAKNPEKIFRRAFVETHKSLFQNFSSLPLQRILKLSHNDSISHTIFATLEHDIFWASVSMDNSSDIEYVEKLYDARIYELNQDFRNLLQSLGDQGLLNKTIIVITSDHGEEFMEHGKVTHTQLYEECVHVPLIVVGPTIPPAVQINEPVQSIDIMPTVLALLGMPIPEYLQGKNLVQLFEGNKNDFLNRTLYAESIDKHISIHVGDWKYILKYRINGTYCVIDNGELYNLREDPKEQKNLEEANATMAQYLKNRLVKEYDSMGEKLKGVTTPRCTFR
jgi:arylsulfatase A-like enzyme